MIVVISINWQSIKVIKHQRKIRSQKEKKWTNSLRDNMSYLTLHSDINTEKIDRSQEIEVWPEMCVNIPKIDHMYPV